MVAAIRRVSPYAIIFVTFRDKTYDISFLFSGCARRCADRLCLSGSLLNSSRLCRRSCAWAKMAAYPRGVFGDQRRSTASGTNDVPVLR